MCNGCGGGQRAERRNEHEPCPECAGGARTHDRPEREFGPVVPCLRGVGWTAVVGGPFVGAAREDELGPRTLLDAGSSSADAAHSSRLRGLNLADTRHSPSGSSVQATPQPSGHRDRGTWRAKDSTCSRATRTTVNSDDPAYVPGFMNENLVATLVGPASAETWRGLTVAPEHCCSTYDRKRFPYRQSVEREDFSGGFSRSRWHAGARARRR